MYPLGYNWMMEIRRTEVFRKWIDGLKDVSGRVRILARIRRFEDGNAGDSKSLGDGLYEMRIHHGPGYRSYYFHQNKDLVILLNGGDKKTQQRDIEKSRVLINEIIEEKNE
jgi:putative addiction module killer protein